MRSPEKDVSAATAASHAEVRHLADRLNAAQVKVKRLARVEAAIVDLFIEIMERTASMPQSASVDESDDSAFARSKRKDEYLKKAEGDPIALLNGLRTHLRVQLTTYEQQHHAMKQTIAERTAKAERTTVEAQRDVGQWEQSCIELRQQMQALAQQLTATQSDSDRIARQYKRSLEQLHAEVHTLRTTNDSQREQLTKRQADVEELKLANERLARERKRVTEELTRTNSGNSRAVAATSGGAGSPTNASYALGGQTPAEQQNLKRVLQDYECQLSKLTSANEELRHEIQRQQQHLASVKLSTQAQHCAKLEKDLKKYRDLAEASGHKTAEQETELLRTRGVLKERDALIQSMKDEYNKLFSTLQKIKQNPSTQSRQLVRSASSTSVGIAAKKDRTQSAGPGRAAGADANENPYLLDHYKARIEQQAKEIERLQTQLRKLIATEYRHKQKNKLLRVERIELMDTCDGLRGQVERAVMTTAKAMTQGYMAGVGGEGDEGDDPGEIKDPEDDDGETVADSNQFCCSISDVKRLRQRNQFLEERLRKESTPPSTSSMPPRHGSARALLRRSSSSAETEEPPQRSIDAQTMEALQQVKTGMRARPQSAVVTRSLL